MILLSFIAVFVLSKIVNVAIKEQNLSIWLVFLRTLRRCKDRHKLLWVEYENESLQATYFHCDLSDKIREMLDNPFTMESDWRAILPVCRYADEWFARTHPYIKNFARREDWVRELMA